MKKLLFPLFALAALTFASCSSDDDKKPVGTHYYTIVPEDNSLGKADMSHMEKIFPDEQKIDFSTEGTKDEADQKAIERYNDILSQIDNDAVCNAFPSYLLRRGHAGVSVLRSALDTHRGPSGHIEVKILDNQGRRGQIIHKRKLKTIKAVKRIFAALFFMPCLCFLPSASASFPAPAQAALG